MVQTHRLTDPKFFGETGYLGRGLASKNGSARPFGSSWPDSVYGPSQLQPEIFFDLKTSAKGLLPKWLNLLSLNLPFNFRNAPAFKLTCPVHIIGT